MKYLLPILSFLVIPFFVSCGYKYNHAFLPEDPINLVEINSEVDDYNTTSASFGKTFPLCFSSNRWPDTGFDVHFRIMTLNFDRRNGELTFTEETNRNLGVVIDFLNLELGVRKIYTPFDELGPYAMLFEGYRVQDSRGNWGSPFVIMYSNNSSGSQDIYFTSNLQDGNYIEPKKVEFLYSEYDEGYPTFNDDLSSIYFSSNRDGNGFDIFKVDINNTSEVVDILSSSNDNPINKIEILNTSADDHCPFIYGNLLVFTSNREGGYGGYDLYYSVYSNGSWGAPQNFGEKINSPKDEFRPIVKPIPDFENDLMIFSSNRPGGIGGFDLYYVGISELRENNED